MRTLTDARHMSHPGVTQKGFPAAGAPEILQAQPTTAEPRVLVHLHALHVYVNGGFFFFTTITHLWVGENISPSLSSLILVAPCGSTSEEMMSNHT